LFGATIEDLKIKDKFCFSVKPSSKNAKKKGDKKYVFAVAHQSDLTNWLNAIRKQTVLAPPPVDPNAVANPLAAPSDSRDSAATIDDDDEGDGTDSNGIALENLSKGGSKTSAGKPGEHEGYLEKKSPSLVKGWQKRYFRISKEGELTYYKTVSAYLHMFLSPVSILKGRKLTHMCCNFLD
jgi:hypothetical protein